MKKKKIQEEPLIQKGKNQKFLIKKNKKYNLKYLTIFLKKKLIKIF